MTQPELVQSTFSLPGGKGKYLDTLVEFLTWLEPRNATSRQDAHAWFEERYDAAKSAPHYLPVLRDFAVIELDLFSETYEHGLGEPLTTQDVFKMLVTRKRGVHYPEKDVTSIMELLSHPVVGALARREADYILVMARETLALRLRRLAEEVESFDVEEPSKI
jgi:hypothetical protein